MRWTRPTAPLREDLRPDVGWRVALAARLAPMLARELDHGRNAVATGSPPS